MKGFSVPAKMKDQSSTWEHRLPSSVSVSVPCHRRERTSMSKNVVKLSYHFDIFFLGSVFAWLLYIFDFSMVLRKLELMVFLAF